ncbi:MAG: hypothetical protein J5880_00345, partial [Bacilli bacterium]|nr:hypothetical protein [Bacilli bacterium]
DNGEGSRGLIGLAIGFVLGIIIMIAISYLITNRIKAAQIAMMTKGVADNELPESGVVKAGFNEVKGRFAKITVFFLVTGAIKSMFRQVGRAINGVGRVVGGQAGDTVTSVIDSAVQILLAYLTDCCLGWVMYRKDEGVAKAACEGAVIFFKSGKTLFRNIGRIFGMGFLSFLLVGGALFGGLYAILSNFPNMWQTLSNEIVQAMQGGEGEIPEFIYNPTYLMLFACGILAIIIWSMIHSVVMRPFILVGVLRNFVAVGLKDRPTEADIKELENKSPKIARLRQKMESK